LGFENKRQEFKMKTVSKILMVLSLVLMTNTAFAHDNVSKTTLSADEVLSDLMAGNQHFAKSEMNHPHQDHKRMHELQKGSTRCCCFDMFDFESFSSK
jgi:hypothetical protein